MISFRYIAILSAFVFCSLGSFAQDYNPESMALGSATVAYDQVWGSFQNPAFTHSSENNFSVQAFGYNHLNAAQLSRFGVDLGFKLNKSHIQIGLLHFDPPGYDISSLQVGAGRQFSENLHGGIRMGIINANYREYGSELIASAQGGLYYQVSNRLFAGAHYTFVNTPALPFAEHELRLGIDYKTSEQVSILLSARQALGQDLAAGLGINYQANPRLGFNAGFRTGGQAFTFGVNANPFKTLKVKFSLIAWRELPLGMAYGLEW